MDIYTKQSEKLGWQLQFEAKLNKPEDVLRDILREFYDPQGKHNKKLEFLKLDGRIPYSHIQKYATGRKAMFTHERGAIAATNLAIQHLVDTRIIEVAEPGKRGGPTFKLLVDWKAL